MSGHVAHHEQAGPGQGTHEHTDNDRGTGAA